MALDVISHLIVLKEATLAGEQRPDLRMAVDARLQQVLCVCECRLVGVDGVARTGEGRLDLWCQWAEVSVFVAPTVRPAARRRPSRRTMSSRAARRPSKVATDVI